MANSSPLAVSKRSDSYWRATFDLRFASREKALFGQPEVGLGLVPGGGSIEALSALAGRSRALEIILLMISPTVGVGNDHRVATESRGTVAMAIPSRRAG